MRLFYVAALVLCAESVASARPHLLRSRCKPAASQNCGGCQSGVSSYAYAGAGQSQGQGGSSSYAYAGSGSESYSFGGGDNSAVDVVNRYRARAGLRPLSSDGILASYSERWSATMASRGLKHSSNFPGGAEVIAAGYTSAESVVAGWMASPGHRAALMSPSASSLGVGRVGTFWTGVTR